MRRPFTVAIQRNNITQHNTSSERIIVTSKRQHTGTQSQVHLPVQPVVPPIYGLESRFFYAMTNANIYLAEA